MRKLLNSERGRSSAEEYGSAEKNRVVIVLDNIRSLLNIGSVFRTADAFRVEAIYLCGISGTPPHREINKTALGAAGSVPWKYFADTNEAVAELKERGYTIIAVEQAEGATKLSDYRFSRERQYGIIFGHELNGVDQKVVDKADTCIEIPQSGTKHSLNIAVAAGIVLWEAAGK
jgi:tRNA G18 (ribose-2'-O)-methylase SpoU